MVRPKKEYSFVENFAGLLGETNSALRTKMEMRAAEMTDDDASNISLQKLVQQICKQLNAGKSVLSVNASSAKCPPPLSQLTLPSTDTSSITSYTTSSSSVIKRKHPPLTKQIRKPSSQKQQV